MSQDNLRLRLAESVHAQTFDGEVVVLDMEHGEYFALDEVGARLWFGLVEGRSFDEIVEEVVESYEVTRAEAVADLEALRDDLLRRGFFVMAESP